MAIKESDANIIRRSLMRAISQLPGSATAIPGSEYAPISVPRAT
jgi:hypothetical protein